MELFCSQSQALLVLHVSYAATTWQLPCLSPSSCTRTWLAAWSQLLHNATANISQGLSPTGASGLVLLAKCSACQNKLAQQLGRWCLTSCWAIL